MRAAGCRAQIVERLLSADNIPPGSVALQRVATFRSRSASFGTTQTYEIGAVDPPCRLPMERHSGPGCCGLRRELGLLVGWSFPRLDGHGSTPMLSVIA